MINAHLDPLGTNARSRKRDGTDMNGCPLYVLAVYISALWLTYPNCRW